MTNACKRTATFNVRLVSLRFIFGVTRGRDAIKRHRQVPRAQRKLPTALGVEEVGQILAAAPGPGLTYHAALGISNGAGLLTAEICHLRVLGIDSGRLLIHVEDGKGDRQKVMLSPGFLDHMRDNRHRARPYSWLFPNLPRTSGLAASVEPGLHIRQADGGRDPGPRQCISRATASPRIFWKPGLNCGYIRLHWGMT